MITILSRGLHRMDLLKQIEMAGMIRKKQVKHEDVGDEENVLDGCLHVFLTAGASNALPIRKLYEPNVFPLSPMQPFYEELFGTPGSRNQKEICTVKWFNNNRNFVFLYFRLVLSQVMPLLRKRNLCQSHMVIVVSKL